MAQSYDSPSQNATCILDMLVALRFLVAVVWFVGAFAHVAVAVMLCLFFIGIEPVPKPLAAGKVSFFENSMLAVVNSVGEPGRVKVYEVLLHYYSAALRARLLPTEQVLSRINRLVTGCTVA